MIAALSLITSASAVSLVMPHVGSSILWVSSGTSKVLCNVRPPSSRVAAMPLEPVASAILPVDRILVRIKLMMNVLPVPPGASRNITLLPMEPQLCCSPFPRSGHTPVFGQWSTAPVLHEQPLSAHLCCSLSPSSNVLTCAAWFHGQLLTNRMPPGAGHQLV